MEHAGPKRHRCSECRSWFEPAQSAATAQKVCGVECRRKRRRRLARRRRALAVQDYRVDERQRQRAHRQRWRAGAGPPVDGACHAPPSACNVLELAAKVLESWDRAAALSRASLRRKIPTILRGLVPNFETEPAPASTPSRATLEP